MWFSLLMYQGCRYFETKENTTAVTVLLLAVCRGGTKLMNSHPSLPAAVDVTLKTDGENEQSKISLTQYYCKSEKLMRRKNIDNI